MKFHCLFSLLIYSLIMFLCGFLLCGSGIVEIESFDMFDISGELDSIGMRSNPVSVMCTMSSNLGEHKMH